MSVNVSGRSVEVAGGLRENGVVVGNAFDKYGSRSPIVRALMHGFEGALQDFVGRAAPGSIHEIGCGEGHWVLKWRAAGLEARGCDFSRLVIDIAQRNAAQVGQDPGIFQARSIYDLRQGSDSADLLVCCEVLEHVENPEEALRSLARVATNYVILSVPREPVWRALNLVRGKYALHLGNTPGHIQHWSRRSFLALVQRHFDVVAVRTPLPWTMLLCKVRAR